MKQGSLPLPEKPVMPTRPAGTSAMKGLPPEAIARESAWLTAIFTAILNWNNAANMPNSLKVTSGAAGIKAMPPLDWTKDKAIYQRWKLWSEKARHTLDCMEGDSVKAKISYFHHWIDSPGMAHIESWKNNKTLISQEDYKKLDETQKEGKYSLGEIESYFTLFESLLAPKSNPLLGCRRTSLCKARFYEFWRVSFSCDQNCKTMPISQCTG